MLSELVIYFAAAMFVVFVLMISQAVAKMVSNRAYALPELKLTDAEMDAILYEPTERAVWRGEAVALEPYVKPLFSLMASYCPPAVPARRTIILPPGGQVEYRSFGPTGASVACASASVASMHPQIQAGMVTTNEIRTLLENMHALG